jgi:cyclopropane-fatty-acyl-phospholipid synthase
MTTPNSTASFPGQLHKPARHFGPAYAARGLIKKRLCALSGGLLSVRDPWGEWNVGESTGERIVLNVEEPAAYLAILTGGSLGAASAYMDGKWSSSDLTGLLRLFIRNMSVVDGVETGLARVANGIARLHHRLRANTHAGSRRNIHEHYDLGNDIFALFLDETMTYSAGIFESDSSTLYEASVAKLDRICRKLDLGPDDHVLEIGSGWGSFAMHAASNYGCRVTTTTISREQYELAGERIARAGLTDRIDILLEDYRNLSGRYDKIVSIEMVEAVGHEFLPGYFKKCAELLKEDGAMLLQAITMPDRRYDQYLRSSDFIRRYIFPGSCVPSMGALVTAMGAESDLKPVQIEDIGPHYATTLRLWRERFNARLDEVRGLGYPERFARMWNFYLSYCEAGFEERYLGDLQMLLHTSACRQQPLLPPLARAHEARAAA